MRSGACGVDGRCGGAHFATMARKETILDLEKFIDKGVRVKFNGGREVSGTLKGFDPLVNIVLDDTIEYLRDPEDPFRASDATRDLGLVVCRGTAVIVICPMDGMAQIANPFVAAAEEGS